MSLNIVAGTYPISWFLSAIGENAALWNTNCKELLKHWKTTFSFDIIKNGSKEYIALKADLTSYTKYQEETLPEGTYAWYDSKTMKPIDNSNPFITTVSNLSDEALDGLARNNHNEANKLLKEAKDAYYNSSSSYPVYVKVTAYVKQS